MAALVLLGALSKILLDYVFKAQATTIFLEAEDLLRFFAVCYTVIGLITFMIQTVLSRYSLERLGLAKTVATLPSVVVGPLCERILECGKHLRCRFRMPGSRRCEVGNLYV